MMFMSKFAGNCFSSSSRWPAVDRVMILAEHEKYPPNRGFRRRVPFESAFMILKNPWITSRNPLVPDV